MERIRGILITLTCVLFCKHQRIFGTEMKLKVKPGDNVTLYCDCVIPVGSHILWIRNSSFESQSLSLLAEDLFKDKFPRLTFVPNSSSNSYDLHIVNITVNDEGIYYCAQAERKISDENDRVSVELVYQYGNRRTHLFLLEPVPSESPLPEVTELNCNCWMLLFSVCSPLFTSLCRLCVRRSSRSNYRFRVKCRNTHCKSFSGVSDRDASM